MPSTDVSINSLCHTADLPACGAVVVGGGSGSRFGGDKLSIFIEGRPLIAWSLLAFEQTSAITSIVLVVPEGCEEKFRIIASEAKITKLTAVVAGGTHRHKSVLRGLSALPSSVEFVAIHDGARPLLTSELITRCLTIAAEEGAAAAAAPMTDTLHQSDQEQCAVRTIDRTGLWAMQTPQVFRSVPLRKLLEKFQGLATDEVSLALTAGWRVPFVENRQPNLKVTWPEDLAVAQAWLQSREKIHEQ